MIAVTAPAGGVTSGQGVLVGNLFGVAATTAAEGESVEIATVGVYELPKLVSAVIDAGDRVAWDDTAKLVVLPGTGMVPIGVATLAAGKWRHDRARAAGRSGDASGLNLTALFRTGSRTLEVPPRNVFHAALCDKVDSPGLRGSLHRAGS